MPLYDWSPTLTADNTMQVVATLPSSLILFALTRHALIGDILFSSHVLECPGSFMFSSMQLVKLIKPNFEIWNIILFALVVNQLYYVY